MASVFIVKLIFIISLLAFIMFCWVHSAQDEKNKPNLGVAQEMKSVLHEIVRSLSVNHLNAALIKLALKKV